MVSTPIWPGCDEMWTAQASLDGASVVAIPFALDISCALSRLQEYVIAEASMTCSLDMCVEARPLVHTTLFISAYVAYERLADEVDASRNDVVDLSELHARSHHSGSGHDVEAFPSKDAGLSPVDMPGDVKRHRRIRHRRAPELFRARDRLAGHRVPGRRAEPALLDGVRARAAAASGRRRERPLTAFHRSCRMVEIFCPNNLGSKIDQISHNVPYTVGPYTKLAPKAERTGKRRSRSITPVLSAILCNTK